MKTNFKFPSQDQQKTFVRRLITSKVTLTGQSHFMLILELRKATLPNRRNVVANQKIFPCRPVNRFRSTTSLQHCSRCTSVLSMTTSRVTSRAPSQISLLMDRKASRLPAQVTDRRVTSRVPSQISFLMDRKASRLPAQVR